MMKHQLFILPLVLLLFTACKKDSLEEEQPEEEQFETYGYEVECSRCDISYIDENKKTITVKGRSGKFVVDFNLKVYHNLELSIVLPSANTNAAKAMITKNGYPIKSHQSYSSFKLTPDGGSGITVPSNPSTNPSNPSGPSTQPTSCKCGARTKSGGSCQRKVAGCGRCWQHS